MSPRPWTGRALHFVGVGGIGMSGLARVALSLGARVSGSDRAESPALVRLRDLGATVAAGHSAGALPADAELVVSSAIPPENPERALGRERGQAELHRAELLGELTRIKPTIAVTGTHGKTTTSSMVVHALRGCGLAPSYLVGGEVRSTGTNAAWDDGEWLVVEADESDRSLLRLDARIAVLTNAELDHHTTYASQRDVDATFREFLAGASQAVVWDRPELLALRAPGAPVVAYDVPEPRLHEGGSSFELDGVTVELAVPGAHNAINAAGALHACRLAGADLAAAGAALADFAGAGRRFERLGATAGGALVVDDYAHHPTEVRATIAAARTLAARRIVAIFQPHLYSRTAAQATEFGAALAEADLPVVLDVYPARERAEDYPGVTGRLVAEAAADAAAGRRVLWLPTQPDALRILRDELREGDLVLTLGAGDVDRLGRDLVAAGR